MPRAKRFTTAIYARSNARTIERIEAVRGEESSASFIRRAVDVALLKAENAAMRTAAAARAALPAAPDRAELEPYATPTKGTP